MKCIPAMTILMIISLNVFSQSNIITLSGGYSFAKIEDSDVTATGWRINGLYEFFPVPSKIAHGISIGYINIESSEIINAATIVSSVNSIPIYYAPKFMFGSEKVKGFVKGALGIQFASLKREGVVILSDNDLGFYGGGGAGIMFFIRENVFINAEYEIAWASNSFYKDGWMNSAMGGVGIKF